MKKSSDPRHQRRQRMVQALFAWDFQKKTPSELPSNQRIREVIKRLDTIDPLIEKTASEWPLDQLNKIDLAILRLSIYELQFSKDIPKKVIIDEAVELAKEFGGEKSQSFINGVLGTITRQEEEKEHA